MKRALGRRETEAGLSRVVSLEKGRMAAKMMVGQTLLQARDIVTTGTLMFMVLPPGAR